jgi:hypothetical protein
MTTFLVIIKFAEFPRSGTSRELEYISEGGALPYEDSIDNTDLNEMISWGILFGFLLLPMPRLFANCCCKSKFTREAYIYHPNKEDRTGEDHIDTDLDIDYD